MELIKWHLFYLADNSLLFYFVNNFFKISCSEASFPIQVSSCIYHPFLMVFLFIFFPHLLCSLVFTLFDFLYHSSKNPFLFVSVITASHTYPLMGPKIVFIAHAFPKGLPFLHALPSFMQGNNAPTNIQEISSSGNLVGRLPSSLKRGSDKKLSSQETA